MAVAYKSAGAFLAGTGAITPLYPTSPAAIAGDIALLVITSENQAISLTTANGFALLGSATSKAAGTAATDPGSRLVVYWKRCVGTETGSTLAPVVADSVNNTEARIYLYSGCVKNGNPWDVYAEANDSAATDTTGTIPTATTTVANTVVVLISSTSYNATSTTEFSSWTNANLGSITERGDNSNTSGLGGGHGLADGTWASTGAYGGSTVTLAHTSYKGSMSIALEPEVSPTVALNTPAMIVDTYYFDGSDVPATDAGSDWSGVTNADDGDYTTDATFTAKANPSALKIEGTNAPASGGVITQVRARAYGYFSGSGHTLSINSDGGSYDGTGFINMASTEGWSTWTTLTPPTAGWTWAGLQALEAITGWGNIDPADGQLSRVEIEVTSAPTGVSTTPDLVFTGTDGNADEIEYNVQVDTVNTFNSQISSSGTIGSPAIDRAGVLSPTWTFLTKTVASGVGVLDSVDIWANTNLTGVKVGIFSGSGNIWNCTSYYSIGNVTSGSSQNFSGVNLSFNTGDVLGFYVDTGNIDAVTTGGEGAYLISGDQTASGAQTYSWVANDTASFNGNVTYTAPFLSKLSVTPDATFTDVTNGADTHPFASGDQVKYTVGVGTDTYYFDGSDAGATDPSSVWTNDANAFDGSTTTKATTSAYTGTPPYTTAYLKAEGTNAPSSGGDIIQVRARIYGEDVDTTAVWGGYSSVLSVPSGGWTWAKIQALETRIGITDTGYSNSLRAYIYTDSEAEQLGSASVELGSDATGPPFGVYRVELEVVSVGGTGSVALAAGTQYFWRVVATDPSGSNTYGAWSATWSFTTTAGGVTGIKVWNGSTWSYKPVKVWNGSAWVAKPVKVWNGSAWVVKG